MVGYRLWALLIQTLCTHAIVIHCIVRWASAPRLNHAYAQIQLALTRNLDEGVRFLELGSSASGLAL